jgi:primase-polymerase (primpol)-like protein
MALCSLLAFWTGGDASQMDRLFRNSGLMREKWDEQHFADGSTYGEKTIERAIAGTSEFYEPSRDSTETPTESEKSASESSNHDARERERLERIEELEQRLREVLEEKAELEAELEKERTRRKALEAELDEERDSKGSLFSWR